MNGFDMTKLESKYLDLLKKSLADTLHVNTYSLFPDYNSAGTVVGAIPIRADMQRIALRQTGSDWPYSGETMIGIKRLDNIQECFSKIAQDAIPGDMIETGVWRGGACIFMRGCLDIFNMQHKLIYVADSFEGLPKSSHPQDDDVLSTWTFLAIPENEVRENFARYGLLDDNVQFIKGWFKDTLPTLRDRIWSYIRLDGDMYGSTMDGLVNLYPGLSSGGFLVVDDYGVMPSCAAAVNDYRAANNITESIIQIDWTGVYWRKS